MAAKLEWDGRVLDLSLWPDTGIGRVGIVRARMDGAGWEYITNVGARAVSGVYEAEADARQDCTSEVRRLLREAGVEVEP